MAKSGGAARAQTDAIAAITAIVAIVAMVAFAACGSDGASPERGASDGGITRVTHPPTPVTQVASGAVHTCMLHVGGALSCVGANYGGQFGSGVRSPDLEFFPVPLGDGQKALAVVSGENHVCTRLETGTVSCWGANERGQAGLGSATAGDVARAGQEVVALSDVVALSSGYLHVCAATRDGTAWCWGGNRAGRLGDGTADDRASPVAVKTLSGVQSIAAGNFHTCALLRDGTARCWGSNDFGQLGDGTTDPTRLPVAVRGLTDAVELASGAYHVCARHRDKRVSCWGEAGFGATGQGIVGGADVSAPSIVAGLTGVTLIAAGFRHTCARLEAGTVHCWGDNTNGQIGVASPKTVTSPVQVPGVTEVTHIGLGLRHTCAVTRGGTASSEVWCWGSSADGQLGHGERGDAFPIPHPVLW